LKGSILEYGVELVIRGSVLDIGIRASEIISSGEASIGGRLVQDVVRFA